MKALCIADKYVEQINEKAEDFDVVFGLGDLTRNLTEVKSKPFLFVHGNHDEVESMDYEFSRMPNVQNLHMKVIDFMGFKIGGFGGSISYKDNSYGNYTNEEVAKYLMDFPYVDIFLAHNPPIETEMPPDWHMHRGYQAFSNYIQKMQPKLFLHGHTHERKQVRAGNTLIRTIYHHESVEI